MTNSMTGYGRAQQLIDGREICVEVKSVNHRFFEFSARVPRSYAFLEEKLKSLVYCSVSRGKIDVNVQIVAVEGAAAQVHVNRELAACYLQELRALAGELSLQDDVTVSALSRFSDIFVIRKSEEDEESLWRDVSAVAGEALEKFLAMRRGEGAALSTDILSRVRVIRGYVERIGERSPQTVREYTDRLYAKLSEVLADKQIDEGRLLTEAAVFAEKTAVAEETVRLRSHLEQVEAILVQDQPMGRKLDFLVQELNREANTIGSKAQDLEIARMVVDIKSEIEKIREQVQNIE